MNYNDVEILFIDDNLDDAALTLHALKKGGVTNTVFHVKDGAEALDFMYCKGDFSNRNIDSQPKLILLDLKMPKVSGIEVLEKLKSDGHHKTVPVVVLTSSKEDPDVKKCYELGANSYIVKPVESVSFFNTIKDLGLFWMKINLSPK
ncbi:response regulator [Flavobacterium amniphilum]|uniref:response regulator n=1 Tax=Flavobacterium amniphilum TaxID=1834035 RepID=UPI00202AA180|nr:response regulator [Flavobacterium amniphilum]MCL9806531.1 response regulator [Flavobacterium amniphilum]